MLKKSPENHDGYTEIFHPMCPAPRQVNPKTTPHTRAWRSKHHDACPAWCIV